MGTKKNRQTTSGYYAVHPHAKSGSGAEAWLVTKRGEKDQIVTTSPSSAKAIHKITKIHAHALKRLADK